MGEFQARRRVFSPVSLSRAQATFLERGGKKGSDFKREREGRSAGGVLYNNSGFGSLLKAGTEMQQVPL